jgi:hypothetical protein
MTEWHPIQLTIVVCIASDTNRKGIRPPVRFLLRPDPPHQPSCCERGQIGKRINLKGNSLAALNLGMD